MFDQMVRTDPVEGRLAQAFAPRSIVFYGASERLFWMSSIKRTLESYAFDGDVFAVNRSGTPVYGIPAVTHCRDIGKPLDAAYIMVPAHAVADALRDLVAVGVKLVVILASNFADGGEEGRRRQDEITAIADSAGVVLIGPNSLGFVNVAAGTLVSSLPGRLGSGATDGRVAIVGQSGGLTAELVLIAARQAIDLSFYISMGNEAGLSTAEVVDYLIDDPQTKVIALCLEALNEPGRFVAAARRARAAGKPIVVLKLGSSALTARLAEAHTGALVGDDVAFSAMCDSVGVVRVDSLEELVTMAGLFDALGEIDRPGAGFVTISGGACTLIADAAERHGVTLPVLAPATQEALARLLPSYAATLNPLDITGGSTSNPDTFEQALAIVGNDPAIGVIFSVIEFPALDERMDAPPVFRSIGAGRRHVARPILHIMSGAREVTRNVRAFADDAGIGPIFASIDLVMRGLSKVVPWWSARSRTLEAANARQTVANDGHIGERPHGERETLELLRRFGVDVVPATLCTTSAEAIRAADDLGGAVVAKLASPDVAHKTEIGGVRLGLSGAQAVGEAFAAIVASAGWHQPEARIDGVLISPMRPKGLELLVGLTRDPQFGLILAVGIGGVLVEALGDVATRMLPVDEDDVIAMMRGLRTARLFDGFRGSDAVDLDRLARAIAAICRAAEALGPDLEALEVNPLLVTPERVEALDALVVWKHGRPSVAP